MIKIDKNNIKDVSNLIGLAFVVFAVVERLVSEGLSALLHMVYPVPNYVITIGEIIVYCAGMLTAIAILTDGYENWRLNIPRPRTMGTALVGFIGMFYPVMLVNAFMNALLSAVHIQSYSAKIDVPHDAPSLILMVIQLVILPPICEEILFRGVLLSKLRPFGDGFAIICSSFLFMALHPTLYSLPGVFLLGAIFAYADIRCDSLLPSMVMHMINNGITLAVNAVTTQQATAFIGALIFGVSMFCMICTLLAKPWRMQNGSRISLRGPYRQFFLNIPILSFLAFCVWSIWRITTIA